MKIKATKTFANFINKTAKEKGLKFEASLVTMTERGYGLNVCACPDVWELEELGDYDYLTDEYRAIKVLYPEEYYACPVYLTTKMLLEAWERCREKTVECLKEAIIELCEI